MATNVSVDQILDGAVTALSSLVPAVGAAVSGAKPLRFAARYMGELSTPEAQQRGVVGRTPCVFMAHERKRTLRTTIGRRVDRVESTIVAIVCSDSWRNRNDRSSAYAIAQTVELALGARSFSLAISPLRVAGMSVMLDAEKLIALAVRFTTRHRVDFTKAAAYDTMLDALGEVHQVDDAGANPTDQTPLHVVFP